jgi:BolA protein
MSSEQIQNLLTDALAPEFLKVTDNTQAHAGHAGIQQSGGGHFHVDIVADAFEGKSLVQRHQLIYQALGDLMKQQIHALGIDASTPQENQGKIRL